MRNAAHVLRLCIVILQIVFQLASSQHFRHIRIIIQEIRLLQWQQAVAAGLRHSRLLRANIARWRTSGN